MGTYHQNYRFQNKHYAHLKEAIFCQTTVSGNAAIVLSNLWSDQFC